MDGVQYCQSSAIVQYAASKAELPELSDDEELISDMVIETINEMVMWANIPARMARDAVPESGKRKNFQLKIF